MGNLCPTKALYKYYTQDLEREKINQLNLKLGQDGILSCHRRFNNVGLTQAAKFSKLTCMSKMIILPDW